MSTCARCGHELGVGRFCTNCGHPIGQPVPVSEVLPRLDAASDAAPLPAPRGDRPNVPHDDATRAGRRWTAAAAGAVLALLLVVVLVSCLGGDEEPAGAGDTPTGPAPVPAATETGRPAGSPRATNVAARARIGAPEPAPATTDLDGSLADYVAEQMVDGVERTCWRIAGDGSGTTIIFTLRRPTVLTRVGLVNGYARRVADGAGVVDWYPLNRRITSVEWVFDDGSTVAQGLSEARRMQALRIDPVATSTVQLRILGVTAPGAGPLGRDYTAISEVLLSGSRA